MTLAICLGETMAMLTPQDSGDLEDSETLHLSVGGAESNVALGLASMGVDVEWVSRVGNDGFGRRIRSVLEDHGVSTTAVTVDENRPTGLYVKVPGEAGQGSQVIYYRSGSAASALSPDLLTTPAFRPLLDRAALLHLSGITPALSDSCRELTRELLEGDRGSTLVSFDVNWRAQLWAGRDPQVLRELADLADVVLLGRDEAAQVFGTSNEAELRALLPSPTVLVIKNDAHSTVALGRKGERWEEPALSVEVVEPVGAGDSFAAGYLSGMLAGLDQARSLRRGHIAAACTLTVHGDRGPLPEPEVLEHLLNLSAEEWNAVTVVEGKFEVQP